MRKEALIGILVLLVAVSGSATVLDSFGVVSGEASVEGPVFYAESSDELVANNYDGDATSNIQPIHTNPPSFVYDNVGQEWYSLDADIYATVRDDAIDGDDGVNYGDAKVNVTVDFGGETCEEQFEVNKNPDEDYVTKNVECQITNPKSGNVELSFEQIEGSTYLKYNQEDTRFEVGAQ